MDPPIHNWNKNIVSWVESNWWKPSKATKNSTVGWQDYGIRILGMVFCLSSILRKVKPLTVTITWHYLIDWAQKSRKNGLTCKKSAVLPRQCTVRQVHENDGQIEWIKLRLASSPTIFSRSAPPPPPPPRLLALCSPKKNTPGKEILLQWWSGCRNWGLFWEERRIILQKRHRKVREALEWMYYAWRKLCWWMKLNFSIKLYFS